jgi:ribosome-binding factor A
MLAGKRARRVGDLIQREVAEILLTKVRDPRVGNVTITGLRLSDDLKMARIYFSVIGDKDQVKRVHAGLDSCKGFLKKELGQRLSLRYIPQIKFEYDPSLERSNHMDKLFETLEADE